MLIQYKTRKLNLIDIVRKMIYYSSDSHAKVLLKR